MLSFLLFSLYPMGEGSKQDAGVVFGSWWRSIHHRHPSSWMALWFYTSSYMFVTYSIGFKKHFIMLQGRSYSLKNLDCPKFSSRFFDVKSMTNSVLANIPGGPQINCYHKPKIYTFIFLSLPSIFIEKWKDRGTISRKLEQNSEELLDDTL